MRNDLIQPNEQELNMTSLMRKALAGALAVGVFAVPASAQNIYDEGVSPSQAAPPQTQEIDDGFNWADAGVGFGVAAGLGLLGGASVATSRRVRATGQRAHS